MNSALCLPRIGDNSRHAQLNFIDWHKLGCQLITQILMIINRNVCIWLCTHYRQWLMSTISVKCFIINTSFGRFVNKSYFDSAHIIWVFWWSVLFRISNQCTRCYANPIPGMTNTQITKTLGSISVSNRFRSKHFGYQSSTFKSTVLSSIWV